MRNALTGILVAASLMAVPQFSEAKSKGCPPGLAKKEVPCVPPGQAKKGQGGDRYDEHGARYRVGDRLRGDYIIVRDPYRYGLNRNGTYARSGDYVYRIDRETREILDLIGAVAAILN